MNEQTERRARTIADELQLDDRAIERRLQLVGFGPDDRKQIQEVGGLIEKNVDELANGFFEFLGQQEESAGLVSRPAFRDEALRMKRDHLIQIARANLNRGYAEERIRLGQLYGAAGLEVRVFIAAYTDLMVRISEAILRPGQGQADKARLMLSLNKLAAFDVGLIVDVLVRERERTIARQQEAIKELSTPVLQLRDRLLLLPIIGTIDTYRARQLTEGLLHAIRDVRARVAVIDITGVAAVDSKVANHLIQTVTAARLMGAYAIITGLSADVAQTLVTVGVDLSRITTVGDLQGGIEEAERLLGLEIVAVKPRRAGRDA